MRIGIIGCGAVAAHCHVPALRRIAGARIVAVSDPQESALRRMGERLSVATHPDPRDLLARDDIDAVVIASPPDLHAGQAIQAVRAGKHIYVEKPVATSLDDALAIARAVRDAQVFAAVGFNRRLHPLFLQARAFLASGRLGAAIAVQSVFCEPAPPAGLPSWKTARASGGGVLLDLASHHVDLLRWFLGDEVREVSAKVRSLNSEQDCAWVDLATASGVTMQGTYSFRSGFADRLDLFCEDGTLSVDRHALRPVAFTRRRSGYGRRRMRLPRLEAGGGWRFGRLLGRSRDPSYERALRTFVQGADRSRGALATLDDGVQSLRVVLAAEQSAASGSLVALSGLT